MRSVVEIVLPTDDDPPNEILPVANGMLLSNGMPAAASNGMPLSTEPVAASNGILGTTAPTGSNGMFLKKRGGKKASYNISW